MPSCWRLSRSNRRQDSSVTSSSITPAPIVASSISNAAGYFRSRPTTVSLVGDRRTRRVIGGFVLGDEGVGGRINVIATAITNKMKVDELEMLDLAYAPPFAPVWDPVLIAAQQLLKAL